jgi:predicted SprT family Zn-dependent metalloprotease
MAAIQATAASVKISKNARSSGSKTQKFFCECEGEILMIQQFSKGKLKMIGRCQKCGQEGRSPRTMKRKVEVVEITRTI